SSRGVHLICVGSLPMRRNPDMKTETRQIKFWDVAPRIVTDYGIIHVAMLSAFGLSTVYQMQGFVNFSSGEVANAFRQYYSSWFILLSPLFPIIFFLNGLYTHARYYPKWKKLKRFVRAVLLSLAVFISANYLLLPAKNPVGRSVAFLFVPLALLGLVVIRAAKEWLIGEERAEQKIRAKASERGPLLIIGGAGYIGCWLVRRLLEQGCKVRVLDNAVYGLDSIQDLLKHPNLQYLNGDCRNIRDVVTA